MVAKSLRRQVDVSDVETQNYVIMTFLESCRVGALSIRKTTTSRSSYSRVCPVSQKILLWWLEKIVFPLTDIIFKTSHFHKYRTKKCQQVTLISNIRFVHYTCSVNSLTHFKLTQVTKCPFDNSSCCSSQQQQMFFGMNSCVKVSTCRHHFTSRRQIKAIITPTPSRRSNDVLTGSAINTGYIRKMFIWTRNRRALDAVRRLTKWAHLSLFLATVVVLHFNVLLENMPWMCKPNYIVGCSFPNQLFKKS